MSCKSALYTVNNTVQVISAGGSVPFGATVRKTGSNLYLGGTGIYISSVGYYDVSVSATIAPVTADTVTIALYKDGVVVPGAIATQTPVAAGDTMNLSIDAIVKEACCNDAAVLTLVVTGANINVVNIATVVKKM